ncbi:ABC transporter permease [Patescibacteria group bacterium]|nr:ABC transporter permease [Patescibacteria group bacterium]MCL5409272.1 ABC transporter permease [Patescibacteria group bacterium]
MESDYLVKIKPKKVSVLLDLAEIWRYRDLLYIFVWRDIKVRYKQTLLGISWAVLQPIASMIIFTVFFGNLAKIPSGKLPYSLFVLCGLVFWIFFSSALTHAADSMVVNEGIIKKVYFPKIILPLSSVATSFVDFVINFIILLVFALVLGFIPSIQLLYILPAAILVTMLTAFGVGSFLAALNVKYRDVRYILPFFVQLLMFLTPVIYSLTIVAPNNRLLMALNPMTVVVESIRSTFAQGNLLPLNIVIISLLSCLGTIVVGLWYFRKTERFFADIV